MLWEAAQHCELSGVRAPRTANAGSALPYLLAEVVYKISNHHDYKPGTTLMSNCKKRSLRSGGAVPDWWCEDHL